MLNSVICATGMALFLGLATPLAGQQDTTWRPIAQEGVTRASAIVDSVFVDRQAPSARIDGGDFTAYLMARLGIPQLPPDFGFRVRVDSGAIHIGGSVGDLSGEAHRALAQLVMILPSSTRLEARVTLLPAGPQAVRFHLDNATVQGVPVPESLLAPMMRGVGRQYPALTETGRDLFVQVPRGGKVTLVPGGVLLTAPPPGT
ncbi:MAG TPA: hypothetical protein VG692_20630 [Gemmatimonadales bacterium]|nr:hypothetical protein [Gemmatimonadales bacterium]